MCEHRPYDRLLTLGLVAVLLLVGVISFLRGAYAPFDFEHFYLDGRYVWEHGALAPMGDRPDGEPQRRLPFYPPFLAALLAPLMALGRVPAALLWSGAQVATLAYSLKLLRRWALRDGTGGPATAAFALAIGLALWTIIEAAKFNQLSFFVLAFVLGGFSALARGRTCIAGALLGAAAALKLLPAIFLGWLVLKRRWSAAGSFLAAALLIAAIPCLVAFGPRRTLSYHQQWWEHNVQRDTPLLDPKLREHFLDYRNESIEALVARLTWPGHRFPAPWQPLQLERTTCAWVARGIAGLLLAALLWTTRRPWVGLAPERGQAEVAVYAMGMLVFSPLLRTYYLVWALPAVVLLGGMAADQGAPRSRRAGWIGLGVWTAGMLAGAWPLARLHGVHLLMLLALGVLLLGATHPRWGLPRRPACGSSASASVAQLTRDARE